MTLKDALAKMTDEERERYQHWVQALENDLPKLKADIEKNIKRDPWYKMIDPIMWIWGIVWTLFILIFGIKW